jgi:hypothetical protein
MLQTVAPIERTAFIVVKHALVRYIGQRPLVWRACVFMTLASRRRLWENRFGIHVGPALPWCALSALQRKPRETRVASTGPGHKFSVAPHLTRSEIHEDLEVSRPRIRFGKRLRYSRSQRLNSSSASFLGFTLTIQTPSADFTTRAVSLLFSVSVREFFGSCELQRRSLISP